MKRMMVCLVALFLLMGISAVPSKVHGAFGYPITINSDGSVTPIDTPIMTSDNITYSLTGDVNGPINIERDNIILDGKGYLLQGYPQLLSIGNSDGVTFTDRSNVTLRNMNITDCGRCIYLINSTNCKIETCNLVNSNRGIELDGLNHTWLNENNFTGDYVAIRIIYSDQNTITSNEMVGNHVGISSMVDSNNTIQANMIANSHIGIDLYNSTGNYFVHNNLLNNINSTTIEYSKTDMMDNGFEGNYWNDYNGTDNNQDGIGDTPYIIDENNTDHYPLMGHFESFNVSTWSHPYDGSEEVDVISNFTISDLGLYEWLTTPNQYLQAGQLFLRLVPVQGENMTTGFCRMTLPNNMLNTSNYIVLTNMTLVSVNKLAISNNTHTTLYFTFNNSVNEEIIIVPEFLSFLILPLFFITTLFAVIVYRKRMTKG